MLYLLDTGRMAYKFGKWRGTLYLVATAVPFAIANFIAKVFSILPDQSQPPMAFQWMEIGFHAVALLLWGYGCYLRYWHVSLLTLDDRKHLLIIFKVGLNDLRVRPSLLLPISSVLQLNGLLHDVSVPAASPINHRVNVADLARNSFQSVGLGLTTRLSG